MHEIIQNTRIFCDECVRACKYVRVRVPVRVWCLYVRVH